MSPSQDMRVGDLEVRPHEHEVLVHGQEIALTSREFEIVSMLAEHPGWVFSATQLSDDPDAGDFSPESVSVLVSRLRQKLAAAGASDLIETVRGFGYRIRPFDASTGTVASAGVSRELRDAAWQLQEAVIEVEHSGSAEQQHAVAELLEQTRKSVFSNLAE